MKNATATSSFKRAKVETGTKVMVAQVVSQDEKIKVNTDTGDHIELV